MEQCPYDPNHKVPVRTMEKHKASCRLQKLGYSAEEQAEMYDPSQHQKLYNGQIYPASSHPTSQICSSSNEDERSFMASNSGQYSVQPVDVPQNHKRAVCDLTVADRLALYDYVVGTLNQQKESAMASDDLYVDLVSKLRKDEKQNEPKSHLELMAEMRDYKRRRQSYRAKNVHITKKSYTEVIREVINVHSEELSRQWKEEEDEKDSSGSDRSPHSRWPDKRRSRSTESRHNKRYRSRERSRDRGGKKKKKRTRESRSPDDYHQERKKKKKKKKRRKDDGEGKVSVSDQKLQIQE
uniref:Small nuclear ribonucleoprotein 48 (U11/U12) n=2 Tax=Nothobranchius kuhntae TaxID=321403 RepID=A0A1A8IEM5_NOTKU